MAAAGAGPASTSRLQKLLNLLEGASPPSPPRAPLGSRTRMKQNKRSYSANLWRGAHRALFSLSAARTADR
jgi:hypothetical protein